MWKRIPGYESYEISTEGLVRNSKGALMKAQVSSRGYLTVGLRKNGRQRTL